MNRKRLLLTTSVGLAPLAAGAIHAPPASAQEETFPEGGGTAVYVHTGYGGSGTDGAVWGTSCAQASGPLSAAWRDTISSVTINFCGVVAVWSDFNAAGECTGSYEKVSGDRGQVRNLTSMHDRGECLRMAPG